VTWGLRVPTKFKLPEPTDLIRLKVARAFAQSLIAVDRVNPNRDFSPQLA
jgi:hypothetical protein